MSRLVPILLVLLACTGERRSATSASDSGEPANGSTDGGVATDTGGGTTDGGGADTGAAATATGIRINELMAANDSVAEDEAGEEDDWVELVNTTEDDADLGGWRLLDARGDVDDPDADGSFTLPAGTLLPAGGHLLIWLDEDTDQGPLHAGFKLDADGDALALLDPSGAERDRWAFESLPADVVMARFPDGSGDVRTSIHATPGAQNPDSPGADSDPTQLLFPETELLDLDLELPQSSLDALAADPFTYVEGSVIFNGVRLEGIGIRLKGHASFRDLDGKAAFRLSTTAFGRTAALRGLESLTLNNMVQDPSLVHEHLAYLLFRQLGVPAPRTAYVRLSLNGQPRGLYLHVESPDERFLARWYDDAEGNLYEGAGGQDLTLDEYESLEQDERGSDDPDDRAELKALAELLDQPPDTALVEQLEGLVDIAEVEHMWAGEILIGHWDGYFYSANNYRVYHDPSTDLLTLLPWGPDLSFEERRSIFHGKAALPYWMLEIPALANNHSDVLGEAAATLIALDLQTEAQATHARVIDAFAADPFREQSVEDSQSALQATLDYLDTWPFLVQWGVDNDVDVGIE